MRTSRPQRMIVAGVLASLLFGTAACGASTESTASAAATSSVSAAATGTTDAASTATDSTTTSPTLESLVAEVAGQFQQFAYTDPETGTTMSYNLYLPEDYDPSQTYPLVTYIADSSQVGDDATIPLSQYGALIWASAEEQAKQQSIVLVPAYPETILDDHGSYTTTEYVEMTARLIESVTSEYSVDADRVYGTGQSMGAMTTMLLAAEHPDLFAAELIVSGQWDVSALANLAGEDFVYTAAAGDENASGGQVDVEAMLDAAGVDYSAATEWDATWSAEELDAAATELLAEGNSINFATFAEGTVLEANSSAAGAMNSEHMASFQPAYEIEALRDWLLAQTAG
ncbi:alpha/beta hydrolase-fold protein [Modestobacter marinus]|nr:alpha/beta hydrolase-fold protein [Modestobacter marinus]NIH68928.1 putative peptidase [Modestobacter marinus]